MAQLVLPRVQAMIICDAVIESEEEVDVYNLSGVRSVMDAPILPALRPRMCVFLQMSGHRGEARCRVGVRSSKTDAIIYQTKAKLITFEEPTIVMPVVFRLRNCVFPEAGLYYVDVLHDEKLIGERRLQVRQED